MLTFCRVRGYKSSKNLNKEGHEVKVSQTGSEKSSFMYQSPSKRDKTKDAAHYDYEIGDVIMDRYRVNF